jgi:hypothetical protein
MREDDKQNMNNHASLSRYILVILCVSIVFTALVLIILNSWMQNKQLAGLSGVGGMLTGQTYENGFKEGYLAAREKYQTIQPLPEGASVASFSGNIESLSDSSINVRATNLDTNEIVDGVSDVRNVMIDENTKIFSRTLLPQEEQDRLYAAWQKSGAAQGNPPPKAYKETEIKLSDLQNGQTVMVTANDDIRLQNSFVASEVVLVK